MATFGGLEAPGTNTANLTQNIVYAFGAFAAPENGTITQLSIYSTGARPTTLGIYADSATYPTALLAQTAEQTTNLGWTDFPISLAITKDTVYWFAQNHGVGTLTMWYTNTGSNYHKWKASTYSAGNLANPFPAGAGASSGLTFCIYATYTPAPAVTVGAWAPQFADQFDKGWR